MANDNGKSQDAKVPNPQAPRSGDLPEPAAGCEWDTVEISGIDFALQVAKDDVGIDTLTRGNTTKAAQLFNRALRIDAPQKLKGRERLANLKGEALMDAARKLQEDLVKFDVTTIQTRAARTPPSVTLREGMSMDEVRAVLVAKGIVVNM